MKTKSFGMLIDGQLRTDRSQFAVTDPVTERVAAKIPEATPQDVAAALQAADKGFAALG